MKITEPEFINNLFGRCLAQMPGPAGSVWPKSLNLVLDHLPIALYSCAYTGGQLRIASITAGIEKLLGYSPAQLVGQKSFRELAVDDLGYQRIPLTSGQPYQQYAFLQMYYSADRAIKLLIDRGYFFYSPSGRFLGTAGMLMDFGLDPELEVYEYIPDDDLRKLVASKDRRNLCGNIAGQSIIMKIVFERIIKLSKSRANVIIHGESGTGKELVARAIHDLSDLRHQPFVVINCGAIVENLIESELFGYKKGAFTGAVSDADGYLDQADGGTLFLDEVGEMPLFMQTKLLRVLDGYGYVPVGGKTTRYSKFRLLCATHRNLEELVEIGLMRADFYYRLKSVVLKLPSIRERREDIPILVDYFVTRYYEENPSPANGKALIVPDEVKKKFMSYDWPGNVRELKQAVISYLSLREFNLPEALPSPPSEIEPRPRTELKERPGPGTDYRNQKKRLFVEALERCQWDLDRTADLLQVSKRTVYRRLAKYGLS